MKELINLENITAIEIFTPGHAETLISKIEEEVRSFVPNLKTAKTRAEIASLSAKVSKSKAVLDALGKDLVSDWKTKSRAVDVERRMIRDRLDALRDEARKPLTDWEIARQANIDAQVADIRLLEDHENAIVEDDLFNRTKEIERKELAQQKREEKQAAEREAKRIKDERVAREKLVAIKAVATAKQEADKVKAAAEKKIIDVKVATKLAEEKAKLDKQNAVKAERDKAKLEAVRVEQKRLAAEAKVKAAAARAAAAAEKKAANKRHRIMINNKVLSKLKAHGISDAVGKKLITSIAMNEIDYLSICY